MTNSRNTSNCLPSQYLIGGSRSFFLGQRAHEEHDEQVTRKALEMELISKLIRSFRDDEQGKSWEPGAQVVAQSR